MQRIPRIIRWCFALFFSLLLLMTLARVVTYYTFRVPVTGRDSMLGTFWLGIRYDARVAGAFALVLLLISFRPPRNPFLRPKLVRIYNGVITLVNFVLVIFYVIDFLHFQYLNQRLNASAIGFLQDASISGKMIWQTYPVLRITLGVIAWNWMGFLLLKKLFRAISRAKQPPAVSAAFNRICLGTAIVFFGFCIYGRVGQYPLRWSDAFDLGTDFKANIALNPVQSFISSFKFRASGFDAKKLKTDYPVMANYLHVDQPDSIKFSFVRQLAPDTIANWSGPGQPNIVLVICESFSAYKSSMFNNPLNTTPYFAQMCRDGLFFDNCFSPSIGTAKGVWSVITGIPDVELVKTASRNPQMVNQYTIINSFKDHKKFYFLGGSTSWANIRGLLKNNIDNLRIYEQKDFKAPKVDVWGVSDKNLFLEADKILQQQNGPFFAIIQTADNHRPYTVPEEDKAAVGMMNFPDDSLHQYGFESNDELNAFRYTDYSFKTFIETAKKSAYFNNTIFVFIGDHGIAGNAGRLFPKSWSDNFLAAHHIPLLFYAPGKIPNLRLHDLASQLDVLPTLSGLANIPYKNTGMGRDLMVAHVQEKGSNNRIFIMDYNNKNIGMIMGQYYYNSGLEGKKTNMVWADFAEPPTGNAPEIQTYDWWTQAYYNTARYLLLNNKK